MSEINSLVLKLLKYDLLRFASKLDLIDNVNECDVLTGRDAAQLLNFVEKNRE